MPATPHHGPERALPSRGTRERILDATVDLLIEHGWRDVTTRQVAERAEVNNALVHYHFGSKRALFLAAAGPVLERVFTEIAGDLLEAPDLAYGTRSVLARLAEVDPDDPHVRAVAEIGVQAVRDEALRDATADTLRQARLAVAERERAHGVPAQRAMGRAALILALLDGVLIHRLIDPAIDLDQIATALEPLLAKEEP